jgi:hypothetical protein
MDTHNECLQSRRDNQSELERFVNAVHSLQVALHFHLAARRFILRNKFGFDCACAFCASGEDDSWRALVKSLDDLIFDAISRGDNARGLALAKQRLQLLQDHGWPSSFYTRTQFDAFQACMIVGDKRGAREWISKCIATTAATYEYGETHPDTRQYKSKAAEFGFA